MEGKAPSTGLSEIMHESIVVKYNLSPVYDLSCFYFDIINQGIFVICCCVSENGQIPQSRIQAREKECSVILRKRYQCVSTLDNLNVTHPS